MDTGEDERERARQKVREKVAELEKKHYGESLNPELFAETRQKIAKVNKDTLSIMDKKIRSRWVWGKEKRTLMVLRELIAINGKNSVNIIDLWEYTNDLKGAILILTDELSKTQGATKDVEDLKDRMDALLDSPNMKRINRVAEILQQKLENQENAKRNKSKNPEMDYSR